MNRSPIVTAKNLSRDLLAGLIVFLVALPLCLGIAHASGADLFSGLIAGIVGGIVVGILSGSHTSVSGPAAGLTAIVASLINQLGSFETFLLAVMIGGILQIVLGCVKAGALSAFFPSSVIKGLLAAIGVILILKQFPHLLGHDRDPEGEMSFQQPDHENTFSEVLRIFEGDFHTGAMVIGLVSLLFLIVWDSNKRLKKSVVPAPLIVVLLGVALGELFKRLGAPWHVESSHLVEVPVTRDFGDLLSFLSHPDFSQWLNPAVYVGGVTLAIVASLETLLNVDAVDRLDKKQRLSPPSRELVAQGVGNMVCGLLGGLPVTSVIIRGSVNINAGSQTKLSAIVHGLLLFVCVLTIPTYLNSIPLSCLAAILLMTGFKLASYKLFYEMWSAGRYTFLPFIITLVAIVFTDLLIGILIGLAISMVFILNSNLRRPIRRTVERHIDGDVLHIELANQVSFLNRAALERALREAPNGGHILLDARHTDYIDPDILSLIREFKDVTAPAHNIVVSLRGFRDKYQLEDKKQYADFATRELYERLTPNDVLRLLQEGNARFCTGKRLDRDLGPIRADADANPHPMAVIFTGIDSRTPVELIFDLGLGDVFTVRTPGCVVGPEALGGIEYACVIGKVKLIVVMGHTGSQLVSTAIGEPQLSAENNELLNCHHLQAVLHAIRQSVPGNGNPIAGEPSQRNSADFVRSVLRRHILRSMDAIAEHSPHIKEMVTSKRAAIVGAVYDTNTGRVEFLPSETMANKLMSDQKI